MESTCRGPLTTLRQDRPRLTVPEDFGGVVPPRRRPGRSNRAPEARGKLAPYTVPWLTVWFPASLSPGPGRSAQEVCSQPRCPQCM